jgi:hypothetical protein
MHSLQLTQAVTSTGRALMLTSASHWFCCLRMVPESHCIFQSTRALQ